MKALFAVETEEQTYFVVAENMTQVVNQYPEAQRITWVSDEESKDQRLVIL